MILYLSFMPWNLLKHINDLVLCLYQNTLMILKNASTRLKTMEEMSDNILACHLLKNGSLKQSKEQLIKATISDLRYKLTKEQLKKIFSDLSSSSTNMLPLPGEVTVKTRNKSTWMWSRFRYWRYPLHKELQLQPVFLH